MIKQQSGLKIGISSQTAQGIQKSKTLHVAGRLIGQIKDFNP